MLILSGGLCYLCKRRREEVLRSTTNMRGAIGKYCESYNGKQRGLTVGLVFGRRIEWREIVFVKKPTRYLSCDMEIIGRRTIEHSIFGPIDIPTSARYEIRGIDSGMALCLLDVCQDIGVRIPDFCFCLSKKGVARTDRGWEVR